MRKRRLWGLAFLSLLVALASAYWALHIVWLEPCDMSDKPCLRRLRFGGTAVIDLTIIASTASVWLALRALRRK